MHRMGDGEVKMLWFWKKESLRQLDHDACEGIIIHETMMHESYTNA